MQDKLKALQQQGYARVKIKDAVTRIDEIKNLSNEERYTFSR